MGMIPADVITEATRLREQGVLWNWISDTFGYSSSQLRERVGHPTTPQERKEWRTVWGQINSDEELMRLHREFAPKRSRR